MVNLTALYSKSIKKTQPLHHPFCSSQSLVLSAILW